MDASTRRQTLKWIKSIKKQMHNQIHELILLQKQLHKLEEMLLE